MEKNKRNLVLVESPNKCATLTQIFREAGYNKTYVFASFGHITEIKDGGNYWNTGINPEQGFKTNYAVSADKTNIVEKLKEQVVLADRVYICSDPDREGEAIAWALKKFLKIPDDKYDRVTFHEITPKSVLKAFEKPRKIDEDLVSSAQSRQKWDKIFGYRLTPVSKRRLSAKSVGRCQSAGLKLVVDKERSILDFVPEKYYDISLLFEKNGRNFKAKYFGTTEQEVKRVSTEAEANKIQQDCIANFPFVVSDIDTKAKMSYPNDPFITSTFEQEVSSKLGVNSKTAIGYAQKLFEGLNINGKHIALITYIRTDSPSFAPEFLPELERHIKDTYGEDYYAPVREGKKGENVQDGHEAIRPVDMDMTPQKLSRYITDTKLLKVYELIYKRTEACAMKPTVTRETTYKIQNGNHIFTLVSKELVFDGYKKAYTYKEESEDKELSTETFELKEVIDRKYKPELEIAEKSTNPPARYKEPTLLKKLESSGIGRPSTYSTIIETIISPSRGYCVVDEDGYFRPTELGMNLVSFLEASFPDLVDIKYTANMEKDLDKISEGKLKGNSFLKESYEKLEEAIKKVAPNTTREVTDKKCPECGAPLVVRVNSKDGSKFLGCSKYPKCKHIENY